VSHWCPLELGLLLRCDSLLQRQIAAPEQQSVEDIVEKYLSTTGKNAKDLTAADLKAIGDEIRAAGGKIGEFNARLESTNPGVRTVEDAIEHAIQVVGESPAGQFVEDTAEERAAGGVRSHETA
jgi:hypothetical protein